MEGAEGNAKDGKDGISIKDLRRTLEGNAKDVKENGPR